MTKQCTKCGSGGPFHKEKRSTDGLSSQCKNCINKANKKRYYENKVTHLLNVKKWQLENKEKVKQYKQTWKDNNLETRRKHGRDKYWRDPEKARKQTKRWKKENKQKHAFYQRNREYKKRGAGGNFTKKEWDDLCKKYNYICLKCGKTNIKLTADHVIPIAKGGSNNISNIQPLCVSCNSSKQDKYIDYRTKS